MEEQLGETDWLAGDAYSLADTGATPYLMRLEMLKMSGLWEENRPRVSDWLARIKARPSFQPALFEYLPADLLEDMNTNGAKAWPEVQAILKEGAT